MTVGLYGSLDPTMVISLVIEGKAFVPLVMGAGSVMSACVKLYNPPSMLILSSPGLDASSFARVIASINRPTSPDGTSKTAAATGNGIVMTSDSSVAANRDLPCGERQRGPAIAL